MDRSTTSRAVLPTLTKGAFMRIRVLSAIVLASACTALVVATVPAVASRSDTGSSGAAVRAATFPHMDHVFVIMMENTSYSDLLNPSNTNTDVHPEPR